MTVGPNIGLGWRDANAVGAQTITVDGFITVAAPGLTVQNTTPATLAVPEQYGPFIVSAGQSWDTNDAVSRTVQAGWGVIGTSSPTPAVTMKLYVNGGAGGGWTDTNLAFGSGRFAIGATPSSSGVFRVEHGFTMRHRNNANDNNLDVLTVGTVASVANVTVLGNNTNKTIVRGTPRVRCVQTTLQACNNTTVAITWDGADTYDTDTMHDPASNNTRITFTTAGDYRITVNVKMDNNAVLRIVLREGGTTDLAHSVPYNIANYHAAGGISYEGRFTAGQYVEVVITTTTSVNTAPAQCSFAACMIGDNG